MVAKPLKSLLLLSCLRHHLLFVISPVSRAILALAANTHLSVSRVAPYIHLGATISEWAANP